VPCRERRREGRDAQTARSRGGGIDCRSNSVHKKRYAKKDCIGKEHPELNRKGEKRK